MPAPPQPTRLPKICITDEDPLLSTHASTVIGSFRLKFKFAESGTSTSPVPGKLNAWLTMPDANEVPFCSVPLLPSCISMAIPSPDHQLNRSFEGWTQPGVGVGVG